MGGQHDDEAPDLASSVAASTSSDVGTVWTSSRPRAQMHAAGLAPHGSASEHRRLFPVADVAIAGASIPGSGPPGAFEDIDRDRLFAALVSWCHTCPQPLHR